MLVCMSCNVEYKEGKKFCNYCGGPLLNKEEPIPSQKKESKIEEEKSDGKLVCPQCKIIYEFGNSCIQCGTPLGRPTPSQPKEEPEIVHPPQVEKDSFQLQVPRKQNIETPRKNFICPDCKIIYERGNVCVRCGAALAEPLPPQTKEEIKTDQRTEAEGESLQAKISQKQQIKEPRKNLICPYCKIIYEHGNACTTCGALLVTEIPPQEKGKPVLPIPPEVKKKEPIILPTREGKQEFQEIKKELLETGIPEQQPPKKSSDDSERRFIFSRKRKKDYRRLFLETGSITIMVVAGGYFLWSIYSYLITKRPESGTPISKEVVSQVLPSSSSSTNPAASVTESDPTPPSPPIASKTPPTEIQDLKNIKTLLEKIRQANLEKNIDLFISCYATDFKDREGKKKTTLAHWKNFDYFDLSYDLKSPLISGDTAKVRVEWLIRMSSKTGGQPQKSITILDVTLKKEEGGWKIKEVKPIG